MNRPKIPQRNAAGRRIGESHPAAKLTDHEVAILCELLDARQAMIDRLKAAGAGPRVVENLLVANELSLAALARKFEVCKSHVANIAHGRKRCQSVYT